ncbi:MAG: hypothetical protein Q8L64_00875 [bacterium]|nr:hypothetical protein [bacterium]
MAKWSMKIVQFQPSYFAFLSGIAISFSTKLIMGIAIEDYKTRFGSIIALPTVLFFIAGLSFIFLSWTLEEPNSKWKSINRELWAEEEIMRVAANGKAPLLWSLFIVGVMTFIASFVTLLFR